MINPASEERLRCSTGESDQTTSRMPIHRRRALPITFEWYSSHPRISVFHHLFIKAGLPRCTEQRNFGWITDRSIIRIASDVIAQSHSQQQLIPYRAGLWNFV